jgi:hypothetical protein
MRPAWPEAEPLSAYEKDLTDWHPREADVGVSIGGIRRTDGGIYCDLLFQSKQMPEGDLRRFAAGWGRRLSMTDDGVAFFEIQDQNGVVVKIDPWDFEVSFVPLMQTYEPGAPPNRILESAIGVCKVVQITVFKTSSEIEPGTYRARLTENWNSLPYSSIEANESWHDLEIR